MENDMFQEGSFQKQSQEKSHAIWEDLDADSDE